MRCNPLGDDGAKALAPHTPKLTSITNVDLYRVGMATGGLCALASALSSMSRLLSIELSGNPFEERLCPLYGRLLLGIRT